MPRDQQFGRLRGYKVERVLDHLSHDGQEVLAQHSNSLPGIHSRQRSAEGVL